MTLIKCDSFADVGQSEDAGVKSWSSKHGLVKLSSVIFGLHILANSHMGPDDIFMEVELLAQLSIHTLEGVWVLIPDLALQM